MSCKFLFSWNIFFLILLTFLLQIFFFNENDEETSRTTQAKCIFYNEDVPHFRTCKFSNICYINNSWIWIFDNSTKKENLKSPEYEWVNLGTYSSSPIFKISKYLSIDSNEAQTILQISKQMNSSSYYYVGGNPLYFHWILDDLFGLWWLLQHDLKENWSQEKEDLKTFILFQSLNQFQNLPSHYKFMIELFSTLAVDYTLKDSICFKELNVGPSSHQCGGPGSSQITSHEIYQFSNFLKRRIKPFLKHKESLNSSSTNQITILSRRTNRKILNENELKEELKQEFPFLQVELVTLEDFSFPQQTEILQKTSILIGIHGSGILNFIFMLPESESQVASDKAVIELFPFGFERLTFQYLAQKLNFPYEKWNNLDSNSTVFHSETLNGLSQSEKDSIMKAKKYSVSMPWVGNLYWINQDTKVDINAIKNKIKKLLKKSSKLKRK